MPPDEVAPPQSVNEAIAQAQSSGVYYEDAPAEAEAPEVEAPEIADEVEAPEVEAPEVETPPEAADPFAPFGGVENIQRLQAIQQSLSTEEGLRRLAAQALYALEYTPEAVQQFLLGKEQAAADATPSGDDPFADLADDDVVTVADAKKLAEAIASEAAKRAVEPLVTQQEEARQAAATSTVDSTLIELLGEPPDEGDPERPAYLAMAQQTLAYAETVLPANTWDPVAIAQAVRQGHTLAQAEMERARKAYLEKKKAVKQTQPKSLGDAPPPGGEPPPEPKNIAEAIAAARAGNAYGW